MTRHRLDLLPLLDVFMVVLFVFATIQEQRLDDTTKEREQLEQRVEQMEQVEQVLRDSQAREQQRDTLREAKSEALAQQRDAELVEVKREADHLRQELLELRHDFEVQRDRTRAALTQAGVPEDTLERLDVLTRVLDKYSVFEIEIVGELDAEGNIRNRCCFRADPMVEQWRSCGAVPSDLAERQRWLEQGGDGLDAALRRTKGGNAMTLVRQDRVATHRIGSRLVEQLRAIYGDQDFYAEEELTLPDHCGG